MKKVALEVSYDGTNYAGFQRQNHQSSIQGELERALSQIAKVPVTVVGAGRTDAGVHALGQVVHFTTELNIPIEKWPLALKSFLPEDIIVRRAFAVGDDFHARYDAIGKRYRYQIDRGAVPHIFHRRFSYHYPYPLDLKKMRDAASHFVGTHDFSAFCASGSSVEDKVRTIYGITIEEDDVLLKIDLHGNGFLYNMVRIIVGTLLEVGIGKKEPAEIAEIIASKDRKRAGITVPPQGLILLKVEYPEHTLQID